MQMEILAMDTVFETEECLYCSANLFVYEAITVIGNAI